MDMATVKNSCAISVVIPCYNCEHTIKQTADSVLNQNFQDYEIIFVNDGSTDNTLNVLYNIARETKKKIRIFSQENRGVSAARNLGIQQSEGKYILFLDSDDLLADALLSDIHISLSSDEYDTLAFLRTKAERELGKTKEENFRYSSNSALDIMKKLTFSKREIGFSCIVYKRSIVLQYSISFQEGIRYGEDWAFATKYLAHCKSAVILLRYGYYYRTRQNSATHTVTYAQTDAITAANLTAEYLRKINHPFAKTFREFMCPKAVFSVAHRFGHGRKKDLFDQLRKEYNLRQVMKCTICNPHVELKAKAAAALYLVNPYLFYFISIF